MKDLSERLENILASLGRSAAPDGLKGRLLRNVEKRRLQERVLTSGMRLFVAAALILSAVFWGADFLMTRAERKHLAAFFNLNAISQVQKDTESFLLENQALRENPSFQPE